VRYCEKVVIKQETIELFLKHATDGQSSSISLRWIPQPMTRKREIILPSTKSDRPTRPIRAENTRAIDRGYCEGALMAK
jgi:hypothetical protein